MKQEDGWEPIINMKVNDFDFKALCDLDSSVSIMPRKIYDMLDLPLELYTPIFAIARISGWSAHRLEEISHNGKIMRPAYKYTGSHIPYIPVDERI